MWWLLGPYRIVCAYLEVWCPTPKRQATRTPAMEDPAPEASNSCKPAYCWGLEYQTLQDDLGLCIRKSPNKTAPSQIQEHPLRAKTMKPRRRGAFARKHRRCSECASVVDMNLDFALLHDHTYDPAHIYIYIHIYIYAYIYTRTLYYHTSWSFGI